MSDPVDSTAPFISFTSLYPQYVMAVMTVTCSNKIYTEMTWSHLKGFTKKNMNNYHVFSFAREARISFADCFTIAQN